jgi:hypothetical protein
MTKYGIYTELGQLELVSVIEANSYEEAREKAKNLGYGKEYRVEELFY